MQNVSDSFALASIDLANVYTSNRYRPVVSQQTHVQLENVYIHVLVHRTLRFCFAFCFVLMFFTHQYMNIIDIGVRIY